MDVIEGADPGLRAAYDAADPEDWRRAAADSRALDIAVDVDGHGRDGTRRRLGVASVSRVDKLIAAARECREDPVRHMLALAIRPAIMGAALIDAAEEIEPGWRIDPRRGILSRHYDAAGNDITTSGEDGVYFRAVRVDLGAYAYGVSTPGLRAISATSFVVDGESDDPAAAVRELLARPLMEPAGL